MIYIASDVAASQIVDTNTTIDPKKYIDGRTSVKPPRPFLSNEIETHVGRVPVSNDNIDNSVPVAAAKRKADISVFNVYTCPVQRSAITEHLLFTFKQLS